MAPQRVVEAQHGAAGPRRGGRQREVLFGEVLRHHQPVQLPDVARRHYLLEHALPPLAAAAAVSRPIAFC
uniref:Uncharacterized protein n=1 Tax=Arundo donax TaxID=35708 RepID=A0A0A9B1V4_ARUDO